MNQKNKKKYEAPTITIVKLNPTQAVLSVCSTLSNTMKSGGVGSKCKSSNCAKTASSGDSAGQS